MRTVLQHGACCHCSLFGIDRTPNSSEYQLVPGDNGADLAEAVAAFAAIGLVAKPSTAPDAQADLILDIHGRRLIIEIKRMATATPETVAKWLRVQRPSSSPTDLVHLIVADRVVSAARELLAGKGYGWLDLRGHLRLSSPGVHIDTDVPVASQPKRPRRVFAGTAALEVASAMLLLPDQAASVRTLARELGRSPSTISTAIATLRDARLVDDQNVPIVPELFWETADAWRPATVRVDRIDLLRDPTIAKVLRTAWDDTHTIGWALTDTLAAATYGAPAGVRSDYPPDFYVPDATTAQRASTMLGIPTSETARGATLRIAPVPQVCATRRSAQRFNASWPLAHPLFVALDLAADPGRGREILEGWTPPVDVIRVW